MKNTYLTKNSNVKGFKFVRRILAVGMAVGMMITALPSVSAAQYTAPDTVVDYFSTFHGYEQTGGSLDGSILKTQSFLKVGQRQAGRQIRLG